MRNHTARAKSDYNATTGIKPTVEDVLVYHLNRLGASYTITRTPHLLNFILSVIGLTGVWLTTHNFYAVLWALLAAMHVEYQIRKH